MLGLWQARHAGPGPAGAAGRTHGHVGATETGPLMVWSCRCPHVVVDARGKLWPCRAMARVVEIFDLPSTSGPVLHARTKCDSGHPEMVLYENLDLLG